MSIRNLRYSYIDSSCFLFCVKDVRNRSTDAADWFHVHSNGGTWNSYNDGFTIRYDMKDNAKCEVSTPSSIISDHSIADMSSVDIVLHSNAVLTFNVRAMVSQQLNKHFKNKKNDVLNIYLDGAWIYQLSGGSDVNESSCSMGSHHVQKNIPHGGIDLKRGVRSITVEVTTNDSAYHVGGYYEIDFVMTPLISEE